ncbi:hypothetical protein [Oryzomonas rubra]|uniref:Uncharacterized protein n=1 Tax=Oryzomonas rubra TaxID=2509454 RepID=A0A5A9XD91_9BACT|nr:hypothetical protein [Oryzomonas rubra]KAA0890513.1 hypothetical protein ET418_12715 [Oryzomonas rubra]
MKQNILIKITQLAIFFVVMVPFAVFATPSITSVAGTVVDRQSVTVNGTSFGTKSPVAPYFWDTVDNQSSYSGLSNGATVPAGPSYPWLSNNGITHGNPVTINKSAPLRGPRTANYLSGKAGSGATSNASGMTLGYPSATHVDSNHTYVTYWLYKNYSDSTVTASNKFMRMNSSSAWPGIYEASWTTNVGCYVYDVNTSSYISGTTNAGAGNVHFWPSWPAQSTWGRMETIVDSTTPAFTTGLVGGGYVTLTSSGGMSANLGYVDGIGWDVDQAVTGGVYWGEVYIDTTWARVEICDSSTKAASSHCEIQIPQTTWNDSQLQIQVNQGSFANGSTAYLFVVDANNVASPGKQITFGSGGGVTVTPVQNLKVNSVTP